VGKKNGLSYLTVNCSIKVAEPHHDTDPATKEILSFQDYFYPTTPVLAASKINFITGK
jgi:hypothetical protein